MTESSDPTPIADAEPEHPLIGQVISERYRIDSLIGEGGMGAVFRATHLSLERPVAIKLLHPALTNDESVGKRFEREALAASKLDHPGCVQVLDFGTTREGMKYLVMQFLDGRELRALTDSPLPLAQAVDFGVQILRALEHAHKRGLVHRDLKPENIFLVTDDEEQTVVKLVDFGIVKLLEAAGQEKLTRLGMAFGTPAYMSPEQAAGGAIDTRTDLYAVGVLLYEMLTGTLPFDANEPGILLRMHILEDPPPLPPHVPAAVSRIVLRLLDKDPEDRFQTAREARVALTEAGAPSAAPREPAGDREALPPEPGSVSAPEPEASGAAGHDERVVLGAGEDPPHAASDPASSGADAPAPEVVPVRSGSTVVADASTPAGVAPGPPETATGHLGVTPPSVEISMSGGTLPSGSTSQGAYGSGVGFDPLAVSSAHVPRLDASPGASTHSAMAPGSSGAAGSSATSRSASARPGSRRALVLLLVALGVLIAWGMIAAWWMSSADLGADPSAGGPKPAPSSP